MAEEGGGENPQAAYPQDYPPEQPYPVEGGAQQPYPPDLAQQPYPPDAAAQQPYPPDADAQQPYPPDAAQQQPYPPGQYEETGGYDNYYASGQYGEPPIEEGEEEVEKEEEEGEAEAEAEAEEEPPPPTPPPKFPVPQYVQPQMSKDLRICDKYFVKPGQWTVTKSGTLIPGTGEPPQHLAETLTDDIIAPLLGLVVSSKDSEFSFFKELIDHCSIDTLKKPEGSEVSEEELLFESYESEYLKTNLGIPLTLALAEIVAKKPTDPIHYLGHWLFKWHYNQEAKQNEREKVNELIRERERLAAEEEEKKRLEAEKVAESVMKNLLADMPEPQDIFDFVGDTIEDVIQGFGEDVTEDGTAESLDEQQFYEEQNDG